ncbi:MAG: TRAM domain-containing protein [Acidobacteria bacterium]|nr:TRAM domain-containing protein [Acidobacteriota bacterium]
MLADIILIRTVFSLILIIAGYLIHPIPQSVTAALGLPGETGSRLFSALVAGLIAAGIIYFELRIRRATLKTLIGGAIGSTMGILGASLMGFLITAQPWDTSLKSFLTLTLTMFMAYCGLLVGAAKGDFLDLAALGGILSDKGAKQHFKILDTSVIIDGRVADISETGFLDGTILIPQFVLRELQQIADSSDSAKRNRGRRGLDILARIQKNQSLDVQIHDTDFPQVKEVDLKLIELGKLLNAPIVTNDFNLNKVAHLRGVAVLNINELANALKPVVLPGEIMKVFILKEGKEYNQGVAYLDDGTMVVVDNARRLIGKNVDMIVTSVLQTTAGKMIFGRADENQRNDTRDNPSRDTRDRGDRNTRNTPVPAVAPTVVE